MRKSAWLTAASFAMTAVIATATAAVSTPDTTAERCGKSLIPEFAAADPLVYTRILRDSETVANGRALLWRLERPGAEPSYIFGTVHLADPRVTAISKETRDALAASKTLLIENANLSPEETNAAYSAAARKAVFNDGRTLEQLLTKDEFAKVTRSIQGAGVPREAARIYRPWIVSMLLAASECERKRIQAGHLVLDLAIADQARNLGIPIAGVETTEEQLTALASVPEDDQVGMLRANLALVDETDNLLETMIELYLDRRVSAIWDLQIALAAKAGVPPSAYASFQERLVVERNRKIRDAALAHMEKGATFIAVGALHLPGKDGLVELFRTAGLTATPIE